MDKHSNTLRAISLCVLFFCVFCAEAYGIAQYSYGRGSGAAIGLEYEKTELLVEIFVPTHGRLLDVDLALNISHTSICDLKIYLTSPSRETVCLNTYDKDDFTVAQQNYNWAIFDDDAILSIADAQAPFAGVFRPKTPLSVFNEADPYGIWTLKIIDWIFADTGTLNGVRLDLLINPEPTTVLLLASGAGLIITKRPKRRFLCRK